MVIDTELKDFIIKHRAEILKNDWTAVYDDLGYLAISKLTNFLLNKAHINPLFYMTAVPGYFAYNLDILSINIPNNITSIGRGAFYGCNKLTSITIPNSVTEIDDFAFYGCSSLTSIIIPNNVTNISYGAFSGCSSLTSIKIPNSVTGIGEGAFCRCSSLTSITIPNSVTKIKSDAFYSCNNLKEIKYTGNQQQGNKLLAKSRNFANGIHENEVKIIFI